MAEENDQASFEEGPVVLALVPDLPHFLLQDLLNKVVGLVFEGRFGPLLVFAVLLDHQENQTNEHFAVPLLMLD